MADLNRSANTMKIPQIIRDVSIVYGLTFLGGFVVGVASAGSPHGPAYIAAIAVSNLLFLCVGFFIVGCLTPENRWKHLSIVALGTWLSGLVNVAFFGVTIVQWIFGVLFIGITLGIGGGLSVLARKSRPNQSIQANAGGEPLADAESDVRRG